MGVFGELRMQICNSNHDCCSTAELDNDFKNDFNDGAVDQFEEHSILNQCDQFDMRNSAPATIQMTVFHEGSDGWKGDWVKVYTSSGPTYECLYSAFLDG